MQGLRIRKSAVYLGVNEHFEYERNAADGDFKVNKVYWALSN